MHAQHTYTYPRRHSQQTVSRCCTRMPPAAQNRDMQSDAHHAGLVHRAKCMHTNTHTRTHTLHILAITRSRRSQANTQPRRSARRTTGAIFNVPCQDKFISQRVAWRVLCFNSNQFIMYLNVWPYLCKCYSIALRDWNFAFQKLRAFVKLYSARIFMATRHRRTEVFGSADSDRCQPSK